MAVLSLMKRFFKKFAFRGETLSWPSQFRNEIRRTADRSRFLGVSHSSEEVLHKLPHPKSGRVSDVEFRL